MFSTFFGEKAYDHGKRELRGAVANEDRLEVRSAKDLKKQSYGKAGCCKAEQNGKKDPGDALCFRLHEKRMDNKAVYARRNQDREQQRPEKQPQIPGLPDPDDPRRAHEADNDNDQICGRGSQLRRFRPL